MPSYKEFTGNIFVIGLAEITLALRELILLVIISHVLGVSTYGLWAQANVILIITEYVFARGLASALIRFLAVEKDRREIQEGFYSLAVMMMALGMVASLVLAGLAIPLSNLFFDGEGKTIIWLVALAIPFAALYYLCLSYFQTYNRMSIYSFFILLRCAIEIGLVAWLLEFNDGGVTSAIAVVTGSIIGTSTICFILVSTKTGFRRPRFNRLAAYLQFSLPLVYSNLLFWAVQRSDTLVIGFFLGSESVGIYSAGYTIGIILTILRMPLLLALSPLISKLLDQGRIDEVKKYLKYSLEYGLMIAIPAAVGLSILGKQMLHIFTTSEFAHEGQVVIPLVAASMLLYQVYGIMGQEVLKVIKQTRILPGIWLLATVVNLGLNLLLIPLFDSIIMAAVSTLLAYFIITGITVYYSSRKFAIEVDSLKLIKSLIASGMMAVVIIVINPKTSLTVGLVIVLGIIIYGAALLLLRGISKKERLVAFGFLKGYLQVFNHRG